MTKEAQLQVESNMPLVHWALRKYVSHDPGEYEDMVQEGYLALCLAVERFDVEAGVQFSTFATAYIVGWLKTYKNIKQQKYHGLGALRTYTDKKAQYSKAVRAGYSDEEALGISGMEKGDLIEFVEDSTTVFSCLQKEDNCFEEVELGVYLDEFLKYLQTRLKEKECRVFICMLREYEKHGYLPWQTEIGEELGISQSLVSRIRTKIWKLYKEYLSLE